MDENKLFSSVWVSDHSDVWGLALKYLINVTQKWKKISCVCQFSSVWVCDHADV